MKPILLTALMFCLTGVLSAAPLWNSNFEDDLGGWTPRGTSETLSQVSDAHSGRFSLGIAGRATTWQGPTRALDSPKPGASYRISAWLKYPRGAATRTLVLSVELGYKDPQTPHTYKNLVSVSLQRDQWTLVEYEYTVPQDPLLTSVALYIESPYKSDSQVTPDDTFDFLLDDVRVDTMAPAQLPTAQEDIPRLRDVLAGELVVGAAITPEMVKPSDPHFRLLTKHYGAIVAGNAMKPDALQPREGVFTFGAADQLAQFASLTGTRLRGHTLLWHNQTPEWFFLDPQDPSRPATKALLLQRLTTHITEVVSHFRGDVSSWDVVNEVLSDRSGLRTGDEGSRWYAIAGADYIDVAFRAARAADPDAVLTINDYNLESNPAKREAMYQLVKDMKARGVPVDAVGLQGHISIYGPSVDEFRKTIERFASLGVKVLVTELDLSVYSGAGEAKKTIGPELLDRQARRYGELFTMFRDQARAGRLDMVVLWGSADDDTWLDNFPVPGRPDAPLLFDRKLQAKPAFWAIVEPTQVPASTLPSAREARAIHGTPTLGAADPLWSQAPGVLTEVATLGDRSASGRFQMLWDQDNLYVLATVDDGVLDDSSKNVYEQDSVEVFVDQNNHKTEGYESDDGQYRVNFLNLASFNGNAAAQPGFRSSAHRTDEGFQVEMTIPFTEIRPEAGLVLGFDAQVNDGVGGRRVGIRNFNDSSNSGWQSTQAYGVLRLEP